VQAIIAKAQKSRASKAPYVSFSPANAGRF
jgi:hypothetical protein